MPGLFPVTISPRFGRVRDVRIEELEGELGVARVSPGNAVWRYNSAEDTRASEGTTVVCSNRKERVTEVVRLPGLVPASTSPGFGRVCDVRIKALEDRLSVARAGRDAARGGAGRFRGGQYRCVSGAFLFCVKACCSVAQSTV